MDEGHLNNPAAQRRLKKREALAQRQATTDLRAVLDTPAGRRAWWRLLTEDCQLLQVLVQNDALALARQSGIRMVGVQLLQRAEAAHPEAVRMMWDEALRAQQDEALLRQAAKAAPRPDETPAAAATEDTREEESNDA